MVYLGLRTTLPFILAPVIMSSYHLVIFRAIVFASSHLFIFLSYAACSSHTPRQIFPVLIGDFDAATGSYGLFFETGCRPNCPSVTVAAVEAALRQHLSDQVGFGLFEW